MLKPNISLRKLVWIIGMGVPLLFFGTCGFQIHRQVRLTRAIVELSQRGLIAQGKPPSTEFLSYSIDYAIIYEKDESKFLGAARSDLQNWSERRNWQATTACLKNCRCVNELVLRSISLTDTDWDAMKNCTSLRYLTIREMDLSEHDVERLSDLTHLKSLRFLKVNFKSGLGNLERLAGLDELHIGGTNVTDEDLLALPGPPELTLLGVWNEPAVSDRCAPFVASCPKLTGVSFGDTPVGNEFAKSVARIPSLKYCCLLGSKLSRGELKQFREDHPRLEIPEGIFGRGTYLGGRDSKRFSETFSLDRNVAWSWLSSKVGLTR